MKIREFLVKPVLSPLLLFFALFGYEIFKAGHIGIAIAVGIVGSLIHAVIEVSLDKEP